MNTPDYLLTMSNAVSRGDFETFEALVRKLHVEIHPLNPDPLRPPETDEAPGRLAISLGSRTVERDVLMPPWLRYALACATGFIVGIALMGVLIRA